VSIFHSVRRRDVFRQRIPDGVDECVVTGRELVERKGSEWRIADESTRAQFLGPSPPDRPWRSGYRCGATGRSDDCPRWGRLEGPDLPASGRRRPRDRVAPRLQSGHQRARERPAQRLSRVGERHYRPTPPGAPPGTWTAMRFVATATPWLSTCIGGFNLTRIRQAGRPQQSLSSLRSWW
jgi:hypothetical protein